MLIDNETVEAFDRIVVPRFALTAEIKTEQGVKLISLTMGSFFAPLL